MFQSNEKGSPLLKVTPDQSEPMVWECLDGSMISRCLMGRTRAQDNHNPSHPEAAPGASSHLPSTQCALRRHEVPSTGHAACLVFPGYWLESWLENAKSLKAILGKLQSQGLHCLPINLQNPFYCCFRFLKLKRHSAL